MTPEPFESLIHRMRLFQRDIICPSEMWSPLFASLTENNVRGFLDGLPGDLQELLFVEYDGIARYRFDPPGDAEHPRVKREMRVWFEEHRSCRPRIAPE